LDQGSGGGRGLKEEAGSWIKGLEVEEVYKKRQRGGTRVWRWKRIKRRGREVDQGSGGGRGLKEEAGRWIKGLEVVEVYCKKEAGRWIKGRKVEEVYCKKRQLGKGDSRVWRWKRF
jgi:hypothetical protein